MDKNKKNNILTVIGGILFYVGLFDMLGAVIEFNYLGEWEWLNNLCAINSWYSFLGLLLFAPGIIMISLAFFLASFIKEDKQYKGPSRYIRIVEYKSGISDSLYERFKTLYGEVYTSNQNVFTFGSIRKKRRNELFRAIHIRANSSFTKQDCAYQLESLNLFDKKKSFIKTEALIFSCVDSTSEWIEQRLLVESITVRGLRLYCVYNVKSNTVRIAENTLWGAKKMSKSIMEELNKIFILSDGKVIYDHKKQNESKEHSSPKEND